MEVQTAYNIWASQYDSNQNKTRDLEALALRTTLNSIQFDHAWKLAAEPERIRCGRP